MPVPDDIKRWKALEFDDIQIGRIVRLKMLHEEIRKKGRIEPTEDEYRTVGFSYRRSVKGWPIALVADDDG